MKSFQYICPAEYKCNCSAIRKVSLTTVRRHRLVAERRERIQRQDPYFSLPLPPPISTTSDHASSTESTDRVSNEEKSDINPNYFDSSQDFLHDGCLFNSISNMLSENNEEKQRTACGDPSISITSSTSSQQSPLIFQVPHSESNRYQSESCPTVEDSIQGIEVLDKEYDEFSNSSETDYSGGDVTTDFTEGDAEEVKSFLKNYSWHAWFYMQHSITESAMDDLLQKDFPGQTKNWKTIRRRIQLLSGIGVQYYEHCPSSHSLLYGHLGQKLDKCLHKDCRNTASAKKKIMYIRIQERLLSMLRSIEQGPELVSYVVDGYSRQAKDESSGFEDFYSGSGFKDLAQNLEGFPVQTNEYSDEQCIHIFLFISTDGAPAFKSSTKSFWPIIVFIGNIPPDKRYHERNVLPVMCIPGNPTNLESFMSPLYDELEVLSKGVPCTLWNQSKAKLFAHVIHQLSDLPARRKLCLLKGSNGYSPCAYCEITGVRSEVNNTIYYPSYIRTRQRSSINKVRYRKKSLWAVKQLPMRKVSDIRKQFKQLKLLHQTGSKADAAALSKKTGITGEAELFRRFQSVRPYLSLPIDLMHLLFENVAPQIVNIWLGLVDTGGEHSYLASSDVVKKVNGVLRESGSGINDSIRRPRDLSQKGLWKADEWRTFVITTSLVAFHQLLPDAILNGWYYFVQICELSMRPYISNEDLQLLSNLCQSFFAHYSTTYYSGRSDRLHLMKYTIHLMLHIPHSTSFCGPLVCLSQFSTERYIGTVKEGVSAKYRFCESATLRWVFQQAVGMCESMELGAANINRGSGRNNILPDRRSERNKTALEGFFLKGPCHVYTTKELDGVYGYSVTRRLERYYSSALDISRSDAKDLVGLHDVVTVWDRLIAERQDEWVARRYRKFSNDRERSSSFFAGEFETNVDNMIDVYFGRVDFFLEHSFLNPVTNTRETRILVAASWVSKGIRKGNQEQLFAKGKRSSNSVFCTATVEDVRCMRRNIAAIEAPCFASTSKRWRTYFVGDNIKLDQLLDLDSNTDGGNFLLRGLQ